MGSDFEAQNSTGAPMAPIYPQAIILPVLGFPAWMLCLVPMLWHFSQCNIAASSLILWITLNNFFNSINPLIWPGDNLAEWWDGKVWCDINARIQVGSTVGIAASTAMIVRKLAKVMDTRNITVSSSRHSTIKERWLEVLWCWVYPLIMMIIYYVVQPARYMLFGIIGCISAFDESWPSVVMSFMWAPITILVAAIYAVLLMYRLYRYRCEFHRLLAARNTTQSRFIRLFVICMLVILVYLPYCIWLLAAMSGSITKPFSWNQVHGPNFSKIVREPSYGQVPIAKWVQVATGYIIFLVFGTGKESQNLNKRIMLKLGLGRLFPSLFIERVSEKSKLRSFFSARTWSSNLSSRAKSMFFSKGSSIETTVNDFTRSNSVVLNLTAALHPVTTQDAILTQKQTVAHQNPSKPEPAFFKRLFRHVEGHSPVLPLFSRRSATEVTDINRPTAQSAAGSVQARVWSAEDPISLPPSEMTGVHVVQEVRQHRYTREPFAPIQRFIYPWE